MNFSALSKAQDEQTSIDYQKNFCIHHLLDLQAECTPENIAVVFEEQQITYQELNYRANQLAHYLQSLQVESDVLVGICMKRSLLMIIALLAILKAGGAYVPLDPTYPKERLGFMIKDSNLQILLTEQDQLANLPHHEALVVCLDTAWETVTQYSSDKPHSTATSEDLAYVIYTSGSTGQPKGVQIIHRAVVNFLLSMSQKPGINEQDILLAVTTISFDIAVLELYLPLIVGACVVLVTREVASNAFELLKILTQSGATVMQATPTTWRMLLAAGWEGNPNLKILSGGEVMDRTLANQLLARSQSVWNMYGPTETTVWSTSYQVQPGNTPVLVGKPIANTQIYLMDTELYRKNNSIESVPVGDVGELLIGGVGLARGYLNRPALTSEKFVANPFNFSNEVDSRLYRTGDLARYRSDGNIELLGRIDNQVKIRGFRIELGEIETTIFQHPIVREVAVLAQEQPVDKRLVAYIVPKCKLAKLQEQYTNMLLPLRSFLKQKLPEYMVPSVFVFLDALPLTPNGKIDRQVLSTSFLSTTRFDLKTSFVAPRTLIEEQLAQIWQEILGVGLVGINDNFFDLGGNSILTTHLLFQIREKLGLDVPLLTLVQSPTIAGLAQATTAYKSADSLLEIRNTKTRALELDSLLDPSIKPDTPFVDAKTEPQKILLTGASGFIGAFLLHELLQQSQAKIYCLVRGSNQKQASQKLSNNLKNYLLADELDTRIVPVLGDLSQPLLGLSEQEFHELAAEIDLIYHNGALVNFIYPYTTLRKVNVLGTQEILKLASVSKIKPIHFISTLDVFQSPHYTQQEIILEDDEVINGDMLSDGYAQSKWVAEKLMKAAFSRGIPGCIYRLGTIIGHSLTGAAQKSDLVARLIKGLIQMGKAPELDLGMSLTPVDYVSKTIINLSLQSNSWGKAFHLLSPQTVPFCQLIDEIRAFGYPIKSIDYNQWQAELVESAVKQENALSPLLFLFTKSGSENQPSYFETSTLMSRTFDRRNTDSALDGKILCPTVDSTLLHAYFSYLLRQ